MTEEELLNSFKNIKTWVHGDKRAPHKPLLILLALGQLQNNKESLAYSFVDKKLAALLEQFGSSKNQRPNYPFVRLANDGVWTFDKPKLIEDYRGEDPGKPFLLENDIHGSFPPAILAAFDRDPELISEVAQFILSENFPESIHADILLAVNLRVGYRYCLRKQRDDKFRDKVMAAYNYQCAVCGFNLRMGNRSVALEAAHIKWHEAGGPDTEENGLALCTLHHKLLDLGAYRLTQELIILVSERVEGTIGLNEWLLRFHNEQIRLPHTKKYYPQKEFIDWHVNEVFKEYVPTKKGEI